MRRSEAKTCRARFATGSRLAGLQPEPPPCFHGCAAEALPIQFFQSPLSCTPNGTITVAFLAHFEANFTEPFVKSDRDLFLDHH
jgi:hypothetical protein